MKLVKFVCTFVVICINMLNAEWNPKYLPIKNKLVLEMMNNSDLTNLEDQVFEHVKNSWCSQEKAQLLIELVVLTQPEVCVEIGAFTGSSTLPILAGLKFLGRGHAYIIDAWSNKEATKGLSSEDPNTIWWSGLDMEAVKNQFDYLLSSWSFDSYYQILHLSSENAVSEVPSIDFLHIDGNFSEEGALLDSQLYLPKVVSGGYVLVSNTMVRVAEKTTKMKALWPIFDQCDIICELDQCNTLLFKKK